MTWDRTPVTLLGSFRRRPQAHCSRSRVDGGTPTRDHARHRPASCRGARPAPTPTTSRRTATRSRSSPNSDKTGVDEQHRRLSSSPPAGGAARNLTTDNTADDEQPQYSPDGRYLLTRARRIKGFYGDTHAGLCCWTAERRAPAARRGLGPLARRTWSGRRTRSSLWPRSTTRARCASTASTSRRARQHAGHGGARAIRRSRSPASPRRSSRSASPSASRRRSCACRLKDGSRDQALRPQRRAARRASTFGKVESVTYKGAGGADIQMWVIYPPGFDPAKKYPLYLLLHGGPHNGVTDAWTFRWNAQVFAGWGYVTAWHNFHGSSGFGQAFTDSINPDRHHEALRGHDQGRRVVRGEAVDRRGAHGRGRRQLRRLPRRDAARPRASVQDAGRARRRLQPATRSTARDYGAEKRRFFEAWERPEEFATLLAAHERRRTSRRRRS